MEYTTYAKLNLHPDLRGFKVVDHFYGKEPDGKEVYFVADYAGEEYSNLLKFFNLIEEELPVITIDYYCGNIWEFLGLTDSEDGDYEDFPQYTIDRDSSVIPCEFKKSRAHYIIPFTDIEDGMFAAKYHKDWLISGSGFGRFDCLFFLKDIEHHLEFTLDKEYTQFLQWIKDYCRGYEDKAICFAFG